MTIDATTIYLWQLADDLRSLFTSFIFIFGMLAFTSFVYACIAHFEDVPVVHQSRSRKTLLLAWPPLLLCMAGQYLVPKSNTIAMMVIVPQIAQSDVLQKDVPDLYRAAVEALKHELKHP